MNTITQFLPWIQLGISLLLVILILLQQSGQGIEGALGGTATVTTRFTRRGAEKILFFATLICAILFIVSAVISILV